MLAELVDADGSARHPHVARLLAARPLRRDLGDAVHAFCTVHGRFPGLVDEAVAHTTQTDMTDWLTPIAASFAEERAAIAHLVSAAGPLPSTPGQAESEAALAGVRHAAEMLAGSDRRGCALGAAAGLVADWTVMRNVLNRAADCFGVTLQPATMPLLEELDAAVTGFCAEPAVERAVAFGARQLLAQHRGLWDLLETRASARG